MKNITQSLKVIALAIVLSFGLSYVYAWTTPTATPPGGNVAAPINTSGTAQTKTGNLTAGNLTAVSTSTANKAVVAPKYCIGANCITAWPTAIDTSAFINTSTTSQYKDAGLGIGGFFHGYSDALFDGKVTGTNGIMTGLSASIGGACIGTGTIARDVAGTGLILSCQGGVWMGAWGTGRTSCPAGFSLIGTSGSTEAYCISTNEQTSTTWINSVTSCANKNPAAHLCSTSEWTQSCVKASTYGVNGMTGNWEWVGDTTGSVAAIRGYTVCEAINAGGLNGPSYNSRCCLR